ncbi:MAG: MFS transporter [Azoarcus sp.]|jgi:MFS family permease|nr:MFS transporter [Azoarcus sp.]
MSAPLKRPSFGWIVLLACFAGLGIGIARVVTSLYSIELRASEFQLGLIAAAQSVGILFTSLPVGIFVQRHGPFLPLCAGSLSCALLYGATTAVPDIWFLMLCTTLVSVVMPMRFISLNTVFLQQTEAVGAARAGWFRGMHMAGFLLAGPPLGVFLLERFRFGGAFFAIASTFLATFFVAFRALDRHSQMPQGDGKRPVLGWKEIGSQLRLLASMPDLGRTSLYEFFTQSVTSFFGFFIVVIALSNYGFSSHEAAMLLTFEGGTFVAALFLSGALLSRWGRKRFYQLSFLLLAFSLMLLAAQKGAFLLWAASGSLGVGLGMVYIGNFMTYARIGETLGMGRVSGLSGLIGPTGGFAGSLLGGWLGSLWGFQTLFLPMGLVCLLFLLQASRLKVRKAVNEGGADGQDCEPSGISSLEEGRT